MTANGYGISFGGNGKVLKLDCGNLYTILKNMLKTVTHTLLNINVCKLHLNKMVLKICLLKMALVLLTV